MDTNPIDTLWVEIKAELDGAKVAIDDFVDDAATRLEDLGDKSDKTFNRFGQGAKRGGTIAGIAFGALLNIGDKLVDMAMRLATVLPNLLQNAARESIAANKQFETFTVQFQTLLGSQEAAQKRLEELAQFGVETPFELPEIVEASRQLEVFGGSAIATGDTLRLIGDLAAGVNQPIQGVAFWVGRMYDALKNGQPFGEAAMRLQEMGILSGQTRRQLEQMAKSGEDGQVVFETFAEAVGTKFAGNMERLSKTLAGVESNLEDFRGNLLRVAGQELYEEFRQAQIDLLATLDENSKQLAAIGTDIGGIMADILRLGKELAGGFDLGSALRIAKEFTKDLRNLARSVAAVVKEVVGFAKVFLSLGSSLETGAKQVEKSAGFMDYLRSAMITLSQVIAMFKAGWVGLIETIRPILNLLEKVGFAMHAFTHGRWKEAGKLMKESLEQVKDGFFDVEGGVKAMNESLLQSADSIYKWTEPVENATKAKDDFGDDPIKPEDIIEEPDIIAEQLNDLSNQMIDATEKRNEALAELEKKNQERVAEIIRQGNERKAEIQEDYEKSLQKLREDTAKREQEIVKNAQDSLAALRKSTDDQLNKKRKDFNERERRETEDHLREMRRLEDDYLFNLQDAVRERDARKIIDLQRNFQRESSRRQEDFDVGQSRAGQDFSKELAEIRQNERDRRDEILAAQAEQLADLRAHEEERATELRLKRDEDLENLRMKTAEQLQHERESYLERKEALDQALQERLAAIAKNLADQKDVTEEGARNVLEIFNDYFGVGGDIDKLMSDFSKRRSQRMEIDVKYKESASPLKTSSSQQATPSSGLYLPLITKGSGPTPLLSSQPVRGGLTPAFAGGGSMLATKPTLALFGENEPELAVFTPASQMAARGTGMGQRVQIEFSGSAPPGIGTAQRDQIAAIMISALEESGVLANKG